MGIIESIVYVAERSITFIHLLLSWLMWQSIWVWIKCAWSILIGCRPPVRINWQVIRIWRIAARWCWRFWGCNWCRRSSFSAAWCAWFTIQLLVCDVQMDESMRAQKFRGKSRISLTSFVFRLGVDRDDDEPERDGGRSVDAFELLLPALSLPFMPTLSRESTWSPFGRGDGESWMKREMKIPQNSLKIWNSTECEIMWNRLNVWVIGEAVSTEATLPLLGHSNKAHRLMKEW